MPKPSLDFKGVDDVATTEAARELIGEYLRWIAHLAKENYDLSFDVDVMVESDVNDRSKFYSLSPAHTLYRSLGFVEIPPYAENSMSEYQLASTMDRYRSSGLSMELRL